MAVPENVTPETKGDKGMRGAARRLSWRTALPLGILLVAALLWVASRAHVHFDGRAVLSELRHLSLGHVLLALLTIYACYWLRGARWAVLLGPSRQATAGTLLAPQLMGFTAVALFGRVADLGRPYLIARKLGTPLATQLGVYSVERTLDLAAAAVVFSTTLALAPAGGPHHAAYARAGLLSLVATACFAAFALALGVAGDRLGKALAARIRPYSQGLAASMELRLQQFGEGLRSGATARDLIVAMTLSLLMWMGIALTYLFTARAFVDCPPMAHLSLPQTVLLMAAGIGGSLLQLPIIGWFTQTALLSAALHQLFGVPLGPATAGGAMIFLMANLSVIPAGLLAARLTGTRLRESVTPRAAETMIADQAAIHGSVR